MEHVSTRKYACHRSLQPFIHHGSMGLFIHSGPQSPGQLVLRNQAYRQQQGVAAIRFLCSRDGFLVFIYLRQRYPFNMVFSLDIDHRMVQFQWNPVILQALDDIPGEAAGLRHNLGHHLYRGPFQSHAPGHDKANISRAQDHDLFARHIAFHIHQPLGCPGRIDSCRAKAWDIKGSSGALPAPHCQDDRSGAKHRHSLFSAHGCHDLPSVFLRNVYHHCIQPI